jgi:hypothetical protein
LVDQATKRKDLAKETSLFVLLIQIRRLDIEKIARVLTNIKNKKGKAEQKYNYSKHLFSS